MFGLLYKEGKFSDGLVPGAHSEICAMNGSKAILWGIVSTGITLCGSTHALYVRLC